MHETIRAALGDRCKVGEPDREDVEGEGYCLAVEVPAAQKLATFENKGVVSGRVGDDGSDVPSQRDRQCLYGVP